MDQQIIQAISMIHVGDYGPEEWTEVIYYLTGKKIGLVQSDIHQIAIEQRIEQELKHKAAGCQFFNK